MIKNKRKLFQEVLESLQGTTLTLDEGIIGGAFNLVANQLGDNWFSFGELLDEYAQEVHAFIDSDPGLLDELEQFLADADLAVCPGCGWWSECHYTSQEHDELVCDECQSDEDEDY